MNDSARSPSAQGAFAQSPALTLSRPGTAYSSHGIPLPTSYTETTSLHIHENANETEDEVEGSCDACGGDSSDSEAPPAKTSNQPITLFYCNACKCMLCAECWPRQAPHRKKRLAPGAIPHEKTDFWIAKQVQSIFTPPSDDLLYRNIYLDGEDTAWLQIDREPGEEERLVFQDLGRYRSLIMRTHDERLEARSDAERTPSLVSFVGQTGAGKSTLIKLLVDLKTPRGLRKLPSPVVGAAGQDIPTSEDVHLFLDPSSAYSNAPLLYADCEGLDGGEREPLVTKFRKRKRNSATSQVQACEKFTRTQHISEHLLVWADSPERRSRQFAVSNLYPRLLYTFSDCVVFVLRNPRIIESVLERLVEWAAAALESTSNQPILPHAIVALNASENSIDPELWDISEATERLLGSLSETISHNACFVKHVGLWKDRGRDISTVGELILCYYSSIQIVRIPAEGRPKLIYEQTEKLYAAIGQTCEFARERKARLRMLLNSLELQSYLEHAFGHFTQTLDVPFDFIQASYTTRPIPGNLGGNILKLAMSMVEQEKRPRGRPNARTILHKLSYMIASCIMLDSVRHKTKGTAEHIFPQYIQFLDDALENFCNNHWPCEYAVRGAIPPLLQAHLNAMQFHHNIRDAQAIFRCVNVRSGHGSKGHQLRNGMVFASGDYISKLSFENFQREFHAAVYFRLDELLGRLEERQSIGESQEDAAATVHRDQVLAVFYGCGKGTKEEIRALHSHTVCFCCLSEPPEHALPCGHILCTPCVKLYGRAKSDTLIEIHECPMEANTFGKYQPWTIYLKPEASGSRILVLDGCGTRGIIQIEILRMIERELDGKLPIQYFFDLIVGTETGGLIALLLSTRDLSLDDCMEIFKRICTQGFARRTGRSIPGIGRLVESVNGAKFETSTLETVLKEIFPENQFIFGGIRPSTASGTPLKVAVTALDITGKPVLFSNYARTSPSGLQYQFCRPEKVNNELKIWEVARATMAVPKLFVPFSHAASSQTYVNSGYGNPIAIAEQEYKTIWPQSSTSPDPPDVVLSLGTGLDAESNREAGVRSSSPSIMSSSTRKTQRSASRLMNSSAECQRAWYNYAKSLPASARPANFVRMNLVSAEVLPKPDDIESFEHLQDLARSQTSETTIRNLATKLISTLFYFESKAVIETSTGQFLVKGDILCRIPNETAVMCDLGKLIRNKSAGRPYFMVKEVGCEPQYLEVTHQIQEDMIRGLTFGMSKVHLRLSKKHAIIEAMLVLNDTTHHSISGFPRALIREERRSTATASTSLAPNPGLTTQIHRREPWIPPNPSLHPSLVSLTSDTDSGRFTYRANSLSPSITSSIPTSPHPFPSELEAPNQESEILRRERAIMEKKVQQLESTNKELETLIVKLQENTNSRNDETGVGTLPALPTKSSARSPRDKDMMVVKGGTSVADSVTTMAELSPTLAPYIN